jgi:hypothetical protein
MLCSQPIWPTAAGLILPKFNKIPNPVAKFVVDRAIAKGVKFLQNNRLECVFPGRFRVRLAATGRGTLIHATSAIDLAPRKTETPRPGSPNLVEGLARDARIRLGRPLSYSAGTGGLS